MTHPIPCTIAAPDDGVAVVAPDAGIDHQLHLSGSGGLLFDPGGSEFQMPLQQRLWGLQDLLDTQRLPGLRETVAGVNNLLVLFDPLILSHAALREHMAALWAQATPKTVQGKEHHIPVDYGGEYGPDLENVGAALGLSVEQVIARHSEATYTVACLGSMPGFAYMTGLPDGLAVPRLQTPRLRVPKGSVMIGGVQAGILPFQAPSGWNVLGRTDVTLFDPASASPCLLAQGDLVRFVARSVTP